MAIKSINRSILRFLLIICMFKLLEIDGSLLTTSIDLKKRILDVGTKLLQMTPELYVYDDDNRLVRLVEEITTETLTNLNTVIKPEKDVYFTFHTNDDPVGVPVDLRNKLNMTGSKFDPSKPTVFITHGWLNTHRSPAGKLIKEAFLKYGGHNVILVIWESVSMRIYPIAAEAVPEVGLYLAKSLNYMHNQKLIDLKKTRLVGHSLGAHVVGIAGYHAVTKPLYIVALDPAQPLFLTRPKNSKLTSDSADNVEVVHTNSGLLGLLQPLGHADFYCNGGTHQLGCAANGACSHSRAWMYYAESINSDRKFYAKKCENMVELVLAKCEGQAELMGTVRDKLNFTGIYYLETQANPPFARGLL